MIIMCIIVATICSLGKKSYTVLFWILVCISSKAVTWKCSHTRMLHASYATDNQSSGVGIAWQDFILQKKECETNGYLCCWCFVKHAFISFRPWGMKLYDLLVCCFSNFSMWLLSIWRHDFMIGCWGHDVHFCWSSWSTGFFEWW